jgi:hypothetical protein
MVSSLTRCAQKRRKRDHASSASPAESSPHGLHDEDLGKPAHAMVSKPGSPDATSDATNCRFASSHRTVAPACLSKVDCQTQDLGD